jgi:hypothetical protein
MRHGSLAVARSASEVNVILPVLKIVGIRVQALDLGFSPLRARLDELREFIFRHWISIHPECLHRDRVSLKGLRPAGSGKERNSSPRGNEDRFARPTRRGQQAEDDEDSSLIQGNLPFSLDEFSLLQGKLLSRSCPNCCI